MRVFSILIHLSMLRPRVGGISVSLRPSGISHFTTNFSASAFLYFQFSLSAFALQIWPSVFRI